MGSVKPPVVQPPKTGVPPVKAQPQPEHPATQAAPAVPATSSTRLLDYTHSRLVAVFDSPAEAQAARHDLTSSGFDGAFDVHCGAEGARGIDFTGEEHGLLARASHALHNLTVEGDHMQHYERELLAGHCIMVVATKGDDDSSNALRILEAHRGRFINQFGLWAVETVHP